MRRVERCRVRVLGRLLSPKRTTRRRQPPTRLADLARATSPDTRTPRVRNVRRDAVPSSRRVRGVLEGRGGRGETRGRVTRGRREVCPAPRSEPLDRAPAVRARPRRRGGRGSFARTPTNDELVGRDWDVVVAEVRAGGVLRVGESESVAGDEVAAGGESDGTRGRFGRGDARARGRRAGSAALDAVDGVAADGGPGLVRHLGTVRGPVGGHERADPRIGGGFRGARAPLRGGLVGRGVSQPSVNLALVEVAGRLGARDEEVLLSAFVPALDDEGLGGLENDRRSRVALVRHGGAGPRGVRHRRGHGDRPRHPIRNSRAIPKARGGGAGREQSPHVTRYTPEQVDEIRAGVDGRRRSLRAEARARLSRAGASDLRRRFPRNNDTDRTQMSSILFCLAREFPESTACVLLQWARIRGGSRRNSYPSSTRVKADRGRTSRHADCRAKDRRGRTSASTRGHPAPGVHPRDEDTFHPQGKQKSADGDERVAASDPRLFDSSRRLSPPCAPSHTPSMSTSNAHLSSSVSYPSASFRSRARS